VGNYDVLAWSNSVGTAPEGSLSCPSMALYSRSAIRFVRVAMPSCSLAGGVVGGSFVPGEISGIAAADGAVASSVGSCGAVSADEIWGDEIWSGMLLTLVGSRVDKGVNIVREDAAPFFINELDLAGL